MLVRGKIGGSELGLHRGYNVTEPGGCVFRAHTPLKHAKVVTHFQWMNMRRIFPNAAHAPLLTIQTLSLVFLKKAIARGYPLANILPAVETHMLVQEITRDQKPMAHIVCLTHGIELNRAGRRMAKQTAAIGRSFEPGKWNCLGQVTLSWGFQAPELLKEDSLNPFRGILSMLSFRLFRAHM